MQIYVGEFSKSEIDSGLDKVCVSQMQKKTGLNYTNTKLVKKHGKIVAIRIWGCDLEGMEI